MLLFFALLLPIASEPSLRQWTVDGVPREALVAVPPSATTTPTPVVFCFHGHGGNMRNAARQFHLHSEWPEAICVYMQGLNTPGQLTDPEGKRPGWQKTAGDQQDRDLKFFDAVLASLKAEYKIDEQRIHSTGHSNGGGFTYLLWEHRADVFASMAPSGSAAVKSRSKLPPKPVFHIAGTNDPLVKFAWQKITIEALKTRHQCGTEQPWKDAATICPSPIHAPVITLLTDKGHRFPPEAPALIAHFFREYPKRPDSKPSTDAPPATPPANEPQPSRKADGAPPTCDSLCGP